MVSMLLYVILMAFSSTVHAVVVPRDRLLPRQTTTCIDPTTYPEIQWDSTCTHKTVVDSDGNCPVDQHAFMTTQCQAYCEAKVQWYFGQEVPYNNTHCEPNDSCVITNAQAIAVTNTWTVTTSFDIGAGDQAVATFDAGATYSYSKTVTTTQTLGQTRPPGTEEYCGYWTFLPYYIGSCGTMSKVPAYVYRGRYAFSLCGGTYQTNNNVCNNTPYTNKDGTAEGVNVFVSMECNTNIRGPDAVQDIRYLQAGVAATEPPT